MKTLDRYVITEMVVPFIAGFAVVLILFVGTIIYNNTPLIGSRLQHLPQVLYFIILQTPRYVMLALPAGALFGCALAVSRLASDTETTMMQMAGISAKRVLLPMLVFGVVLCGVAYVFQEKVTVWAEQKSLDVYQWLASAPGPLPIQANVVFWVDDYCFYVNTVHRDGDKVKLGKVLIYEPPITVNGFPTLTTAESATEQGRVCILKKGAIFRMSNSGDPELVGKFESMKLDLRRALGTYLNQGEKLPEAMSIGELREQMNILTQSGQKTDRYRLEMGSKLALPLSSLILILCVGPLSFRLGRRGGFMGVLLGIGVLFFYYNVMVFSKIFGENNLLSPSIAGWSQAIVFTVVGVFLLLKVD
ncbi:MAG: YjgP/YjgQ family permease [Armatimonadetes bacterium]|jgi:lipopolysaccharide export system permease protein|nr:YjgP/YjgQ family permease [Armatimonadota bacterium]